MTIRPATHADIPAMVALGAILCAEAPAYGHLAYSPERTAETVQRLVDEDYGLALVAERGAQLVGYVLACAHPRPFHEGLAAIELSLFVAPEARGSRAAVGLIRAMEGWAVSMGATTLNVGTSTGYRTDRTVGLYELLGYARDAETLQKVLQR